MNQQALVEKTGEELRDAGIKQAIDHANEVIPEWSDRAYEVVQDFLKISPLAKIGFMGEELRLWAHQDGGLPQPENLRAWGGVVRKAASHGLIEKVRIDTVKNPKAHAANAAVWRKK